MLCDYCGSHFPPESIRDDTHKDARQNPYFDGYVYVCPSCGGELMTTAPNDAVGFCPYCGGASMLFDRVRQIWPPDEVIPFRITKDQCRQIYTKEVRRHPLVSRKYRDPKLIDSFRGIYMPYWRYQAKHEGQYAIHAVSEPREKHGLRITYYYKLTGDTDISSEGYTHDASRAFADSLSECIEPYDQETARPFTPGYLSGFYSEVADVKEEEYQQVAENALSESVQERLFSELSDHQELTKRLAAPFEAEIPIELTRSRRTLQPVWFMSYRNKNRLTYAAVNGQTGKIHAELPISPLRFLLAVLLVAAALFLPTAVLTFLPSIRGRDCLWMCLHLMLAGLFFTREWMMQTAEPGAKKHNTRKEYRAVSICFLVTQLAIVLLAVDGSYAGVLRFFAIIMLVFSVGGELIFQFCSLVDYFGLRKRVRHVTADDPLYDVRRLIRSSRWLHILIIVLMTIFAFTALGDSSPKTTYYTMSLILAVLLFLLVAYHARYQRDAARRLPPQFQKKGALYDDN